jgi:hypothetical protein
MSFALHLSIAVPNSGTTAMSDEEEVQAEAAVADE